MTAESRPSNWEPVAKRVLERLAKQHKLKKPLLAGRTEAKHPKTRRRIYQFTVVSADDANGPRYSLITDGTGKALDATPELEALFDLAIDARKPAEIGGLPSPAGAPATIEPDENILTLNPGGVFEETITVTIPKNSGAPKADVYFLADTTASMSGILSAVQAGANNILTALSGLGLDLAYGVGNYKDFPNDPYAFQHQQNPTTTAANVAAAINAWAASGGSDGPEGQLFALDSLATPPGGAIGWRTGSKRIIVWFGDVPGHDPICAAISGAAADITEATVTAKLTSENITVLAISTATPGLDGDPASGATDYTSACGAPGGAAGQATRLASATGGAFVTGINPSNVVNTIISLVGGALGSINSVKLVPSAPIAPFVTSITPPEYGPLAADEDHTLTFRVRFEGIPCKEEEQIFTGTLDVVADGNVIASKRVRITVPPCEPKFVYSVKFVCGTQPDCPCECAPLRSGDYATEINIHNYSGRSVKIRKRVIPVVLAGAPVGREPAAAVSRAEDRVSLPPHSATMDDCCRLAQLLFGEGASPALNIGFLEITAEAEVAVTAVYTYSGQDSGVSIDVREIRGRRQ